MTGPHGLPDPDDLLAAELAFGLLDADGRHEAERRLGGDPAFAEAFYRWQAYAAALAAGTTENPPSSLWPSIKARIAANDVAARQTTSTLRRWQAVTAIALIAAAGLGVFAIQRPPPPAADHQSALDLAPIVAMLESKKDSAMVAINYDRSNHHLTVLPTALHVPHGSAQLWVIPGGGKPRSLGVIDATRPAWAIVSSGPASVITPGATLAISVEPLGGSPTGQPTGPVILSGPVQPA